jgi:hypothetical protein
LADGLVLAPAPKATEAEIEQEMQSVEEKLAGSSVADAVAAQLKAIFGDRT